MTTSDLTSDAPVWDPPDLDPPDAGGDDPKPDEPGPHPTTAVVALAVGTLAAGALLAANEGRDAHGDLDWFYVGLQIAVAAVAVLGALAMRMVVTDRETRQVSVGWPMAFGAFAVGAVLANLITDEDTAIYVVGAVVLVVGALGYLLAPGGACALAVIGGLLLLYGKIVGDTIDPQGETAPYQAVILAALVFTLVVTALGWMLPRSRAVTTAVVGAGAVLVHVGVLGSFAFFSLFTGGFGEEESARPDVDAVVWTGIASAAILVVVWLVVAAVLKLRTPLVLAVAMTAVMIPTAVAVWGHDPKWWALGATIAGAVALGGVSVRAMLSRP